MADLWWLLVWSQSYDRRHLRETLDAVSARGREVVKCKTLQDVLAATSGLPVGRTAAGDAHAARRPASRGTHVPEPAERRRGQGERT